MNSSTMIHARVIPQSVIDTLPIAHERFDEPELIAELPTPKPAPGLFESVGWCVVYVVFAMMLPAVVLALWSMATTGNVEMVKRYALHALLVGDCLGVALSVSLLRWRVGRDWMSAIHLRRPKLAPTILAVLCLPTFMMIAGGATQLLGYTIGEEEPSRQYVLDCLGGNPFWFCVLVIGVGAGVSEELFCRGFLGRGLLGRYGVVGGILLTSLLFGALHMSLTQGLFALLLGIYMHAAYLATRSLWVPMLLHFLNNAFAATTLLLIADFDPTLTQNLVAIAATTVIGVPAAYGLWRLRERQTAEFAV